MPLLLGLCSDGLPVREYGLLCSSGVGERLATSPNPYSCCSHPLYPTCPHWLTATLSLPGVAISTYAKYCYHKLQKAALTGAKKVQMLLGEAGWGTWLPCRPHRSLMEGE